MVHRQLNPDKVTYVPEAKKLKVLQLINYLQEPRKIEDITKRFDLNKRTAYRYVNLISNCGFVVEKHSDGWYTTTYRINIEHKCPLCGEELRK